MKTYIVGNWKMNQSLEEIKSFCGDLDDLTENGNVETWIAPQAVHMTTLMNESNKLKVGSQNCSNQTSGAHTGEISPVTLRDLGAHFTIIGHSERRAIYKEDDKFLNEKAILALNEGLTVIFCCGETKEEREDNRTMHVVSNQLKNGLANLPTDKIENLLIAYEPVWAIGTGLTASPEQAEEVHAEIRTLMGELYGEAGAKTPILYGGSVKPSNISELLDQVDIDGGLIGGASLKSSDYKELVRIAAEKN